MRQQKETEAETEEAEAVRDRDSRNREGEKEKGGVRNGGESKDGCDGSETRLSTSLSPDTA